MIEAEEMYKQAQYLKRKYFENEIYLINLSIKTFFNLLFLDLNNQSISKRKILYFNYELDIAFSKRIAITLNMYFITFEFKYI